MSAASDYLEDKVLDHVLGKGTRNFTSPSELHVALFTGTASAVKANLEAGTLTDEVGNANSYARTAATFGAASSGSASNSASIEFPAAQGGNWGTVTCAAVMDSATYGAGNVLFYGELAVSKTVTDGDTFRIDTNQLTISLD
jgi:hypothetical protein